MKIWKGLSVIGGIAVFFGILFHLQGQAIVGPPSSFMYANPEWIGTGMVIAIAGAASLGVGILLFFRKI